MPKFYLNLFNDMVAFDEEGREFVDIAEAKAAAISSARDLMAEHVRTGHPVDLNHRIEVVSETGKVLAVIPFREIVTIKQ